MSNEENKPDLRSDAVIFDDYQISQVEKMASFLTMDQIADVMGVGRTTFVRIRERQPEVEEAYQRGRAEACYQVAESLFKNAKRGHFPSQKFYLGTQFGWVEKKVIAVTKNALDEVMDHIIDEEPAEENEE